MTLRLRLPLLVSGVIALSLVAFLAVSYQQVRRELLNAGQARARAAADQLGSLLAQSAQQQVTDTHRAAQDPALRRYLEQPGEPESERARQRLSSLAGAGQPPVELWDNAGTRRLTAAAKSDRPVPELPAGSKPSAEGVGAFQAAGDTVYWDVVAAVRADGTESVPRGFVVSRRSLSRAGNSDAVRKLVGPEAVIKLGNAGGGAWSDLSKSVAQPNVAVQPGAVLNDRARDGSPLVGAASLVRGTPWIVLVEFPQREFIAPARAFLGRMLLVAAALVLAAGAVTYASSGGVARQ